MKGIILAGGLGTRLSPLTDATNKHLLPVGREPMIYHPIRQLVGSGIDDLLVVSSTDHMGDVVRCLGSGQKLGCSLTYRVQETPGGIAHALKLGRNFVGGDRVVVVLGDNVFQYAIAPYVDAFRKQASGARVLLKEVGDPERYGVAALDEKQVIEIEEKPANPKSKFAVVGLYMYDDSLWSILDDVQPSRRGELEITTVNNAYIARGALQYDICRGRWTDAGTFASLAEANAILLAANNEILAHD